MKSVPGPDRRRTSFAVTIVVAAALTLAACGGASAGQTRDVPEFQSAILDDGEITPSEYDYAVAATMVCTEQAGARVVRKDREDGRLGFEYGGTATEPEMQPLIEAYNDCYEKYLIEVDRRWAEQYRLTAGEIYDQHVRFVQCAEALGLVEAAEITPARVSQVLQQIPSLPHPEAGRCAHEAYEDEPYPGMELILPPASEE